MSRLRLVLPAAVVIGAFMISPAITRANINYSKKENKPCITCHVSVKTKELNAVGKCYKEKQKLEGCAAK